MSVWLTLLVAVFAGGFFGAAIAKTVQAKVWLKGYPLFLAFLQAWQLWAIACGLTILEVVAFIARKG